MVRALPVALDGRRRLPEDDVAAEFLDETIHN
jgi:hypothetical protein